MDYSNLRKVISSKEAEEKVVSVNHKALITRTLTKYPVDYALYRELLQNSADARASSVVISYKSVSGTATNPETIESLQDAPINRLTVSNNGNKFEDDDWSRLREIAKGNPNESKIGAFGVGFYSVFELTDEPLVHSDTEAMSFYYVEDQLRYRKDTVEKSEWTVIDLPYRAPGVLPNLISFTAFLTQSFMLVPLSSIVLEVDGTKLLELKKTTSPGNEITIPRNIGLNSTDRTLALRSVSSEAFQVSVRYMNVTQVNTSGARANILNFGKKLLNSFITASESPSDYTEVVCFLRKITGVISVNVSRQFAAKMKETVMKPPPKEAVISMLSHSREEKDVSELKPPLSDYIFPKEYGDAKIYIGFPTKQSTSMKSHLAMSQLIPTMERTSIDMSNSFVKTWNEQMLYMAGILSRVVYDQEMTDLSKIKDDNKRRTDSACYIMNKFAFHRSTPDAIVGKWIASGFWRSSKTLPVPSQLGIHPSNVVRYAGDATFIRTIPILPEEVFSNAGEFIEKAQLLGLIEELSPEDVIKEVQSRTLDLEDMKRFINWCAKSLRNESLNKTQVMNMLKETVVSDGDDTFQLGMVKRYQMKQSIEDDLPLPPNCIKQGFVSSIGIYDLELMGWKELNVVEWFEYVVNASLPVEQKLSVSAEFAKRVLKKVAEYWFSFNPHEKAKTVELLSKCTCIPTQLGMKLPSESYLMEIPMFPHLPVRTKDLPIPDNLLLSIGVRESVDMAFVLKLLHNPEKGFEWSTFDVTKYLTANSKKLKSSDWQLLRTSSFFEATDGKLYKAHELYGPNQLLRDIGFRTLKWESWDDGSEEAKLLYMIGLNKNPTVNELFGKADSNREKALLALQYYVENFSRNGYKESVTAKIQAKIIPCSTNGNIVTLESPMSCYSDQRVEMFGFPIVQKKYRAEAWKLGVREAPKIHLLVNSMVSSPPKNHEDAENKFSYLSGQANELNSVTLKNIKDSKFIPVEHDEKVGWYPPTNVFLELPGGDETKTTAQYFKGLFNYVKFKDGAIPFLLKIGVRYAPKLPEIIRTVIRDPFTAYNECGGRENYEKFLLDIGMNWNKLDRGLILEMQKAKFMIGLIVEKNDYEKETEKVSLVGIHEVAVVDDVIAFNWFKSYIKTAPQVRELEKIYYKLGAPGMSEISYETINKGRNVENVEVSQKLKKHLIERSVLFLEAREDVAGNVNLETLNVRLVTSIQVVRQAILGPMKTPQFKESICASLDHRNPKELYVVVQNSGWTVDWYDLSKAVVKLILKKPNPESVIILETYLSSDLSMLRKKGINVDRLLKEKEREKEKLEEEKVRMREERIKREQEKEQQIKREMSQVKGPESQQNLTGGDKPPVQPPAPSSSSTKSLTESGTDTGFFNKLKKSIKRQPSQVGKPVNTSGDMTMRRLESAIRDTKPFTGKNFSNRILNVDDKEIEFSCQPVAPTELGFVTRIPGGPSCYNRTNGPEFDDVELIEAGRFKTVLKSLSEVFQCPWDSIHIYLDNSHTIAFNSNGSLFFNLHFFCQEFNGPNRAMGSDWSFSNSMNYWYPVMAHELAHNIVSPHGSNHSFFTESFIQHFMNAFKSVTSRC